MDNQKVNLIRHGQRLSLVLIALVLAGCAALPPADPTPSLRQPDAAEFVRADQGDWPAADWWHGLNDPQLDQLIQRALAHSPSLAVAQARLAQAQAASGVTAADSGMQLTGNASVERARQTENGLIPKPYAGTVMNNGRLALDFSYDFDWWGRHRASLDAALGRERAARVEAEGAAATLSTAVAASYLHWQALNARVDLAQQIEKQRASLLELDGRRVKAGLAAGDTLLPLQADLAAARQTVVQLQSQREQALVQLKSLTGPSADFPALQARPLPKVAAALPANLPLDLVSRRADVAAARDQVEAGLKDVDAARARFYPDVNLSAFLGFSSISMSKLVSSGSLIAGVTPAIHLPIFDTGRLKANLNTARAGVALNAALYEQTLERAVADVNDAALRVQGADAEAAPLAAQRDARVRDRNSLARRRSAGLIDSRELYRAEAALQSLDDQEQLRLERQLLAKIDLIKALGGGWTAGPGGNPK